MIVEFCDECGHQLRQLPGGGLVCANCPCWACGGRLVMRKGSYVCPSCDADEY